MRRWDDRLAEQPGSVCPKDNLLGNDPEDEEVNRRVVANVSKARESLI